MTLCVFYFYFQLVAVQNLWCCLSVLYCCKTWIIMVYKKSLLIDNSLFSASSAQFQRGFTAGCMPVHCLFSARSVQCQFIAVSAPFQCLFSTGEVSASFRCPTSVLPVQFAVMFLITIQHPFSTGSRPVQRWLSTGPVLFQCQLNKC